MAHPIKNKTKRKLVADIFQELLNKGYSTGQASMFITRHSGNKSDVKVLKQILHEAKNERRIY